MTKTSKPDLIFVPRLHKTPAAIEALIGSTQRLKREGAIIASLTELEVNNPRIKIKHKLMYNLRISGILQEVDIKGNKKDSAGAVEVEDATGRVVANVGTGLDRETRLDIWKNPQKWMHELIQVETMGLAKPGGRLRMPVYNGIADGAIDTVE